MNTMLTLPRIPASIPTTLVPTASRLRSAQLARTLLDLGLINEDTLPTGRSVDHLKACQAALDAWLRKSLGGLQCLGARFTILVGVDGVDPDDVASDPQGLWGEISWYSCAGNWSVGDALEHLERLKPRLGETVLRVLHDTAWNSMPLFTPWETLGAATMIYWCGEDNEDIVLEENCGDDAGAREDMAESMVKRADFDAVFPAWALKMRKARGLLSTRTLKAFGSANNDERVKAVLADVVLLMGLQLKPVHREEMEGYFLGYAGVLTWKANDRLTFRVEDDYSQMVGEGGDFFEELGTVRMRLDAPHGLTAWMQDMEAWFQAVRLLDHLLQGLSAAHWSQEGATRP